nr:MAG TPA: hypothetical protein [Caudoviricetes sp.]
MYTMQWQILELRRTAFLSSTRPEKLLYLNNLPIMATLRKLSLQQQATLFAPDLTKIEEKQKKKIYFFKRLVYDRLQKLIIERVEDQTAKAALLRELESILQMKHDVPEVAAMQKIIKIKDVPAAPDPQKSKLSDEELLQLVAQRYEEDPTFLQKLSNALTF